MMIEKKYLLDNLSQQLDIIENASNGDLTEYQCGYIAGLNYLIDLIIDFKPDPIKKDVIISPGFTLGKKRKEKIDTPKQDNRKHRFTWKRK